MQFRSVIDYHLPVGIIIVVLAFAESIVNLITQLALLIVLKSYAKDYSRHVFKIFHVSPTGFWVDYRHAASELL
jgi:hypothetical protein